LVVTLGVFLRASVLLQVHSLSSTEFAALAASFCGYGVVLNLGRYVVTESIWAINGGEA
jgi:hypothetical protein